MTDESSESPSPLPPDQTFEHEAISIETTEIHPNLFKVDFEVPAEQVLRFIRQLRSVKTDIKPQETASLMISVCLDESLARLDRRRIFEPIMAEGSTPPVLHPDKPFRGTFIQDAFAVPDWPDFSLLSLSASDLEVTDELVEQELLDQKLDAGTRTELTDPIASMDEIVADVTMRMRAQDQAFMEISKLTARVPGPGQKMSLGQILIDGGDALIGQTAGSTVTFPATLPENFPNSDFRGRDVEVELQIKSGQRISPATAEQVAERFGTPNVDVLKMQIRFALENRLSEQKRTDARDQLMPQVRQMVPIEIPDHVVKQMVARQMPSVIDQARKDGLDEEAIKKHVEKESQKIEIQAKSRANRRVLLQMLAEHLNVEIGEEEILEEIRNEAALTGRRPEELRKQLVDEERIPLISERVRELKIVDKLIPMATSL